MVSCTLLGHRSNAHVKLSIIHTVSKSNLCGKTGRTNFKLSHVVQQQLQRRTRWNIFIISNLLRTYTNIWWTEKKILIHITHVKVRYYCVLNSFELNHLRLINIIVIVERELVWNWFARWHRVRWQCAKTA